MVDPRDPLPEQPPESSSDPPSESSPELTGDDSGESLDSPSEPSSGSTSEPASASAGSSADTDVELPDLSALFGDELSEPVTELPDLSALFGDEPSEPVTELPDLSATASAEPAAELPDLGAEQLIALESEADLTATRPSGAASETPAVSSGRTASAGIPPSTRNPIPLHQRLPFDLHRVAGLLIIFSAIGTILGVGLTQTLGKDEEGILDVPLFSTEQASESTNPPGSPLISIRPDAESTSDEVATDINRRSQQQPTSVDAVPSRQRRLQAQQPSRETQSPVGGIIPPIISEPLAKPPATSPPPTVDISDVPADHWAYPFVKALHEEGIVPDFPDGKFQPDKPVTRAELAAQIQRAFKDDSEQRALNFTDVAEDYWANAAIQQAVKSGFMNGYPEGDFRPDRPVPRYEVLVALVSGLELDKVANPDARLDQFQDRQDLPSWSEGQIAAATDAGLVVNHPEPAQLDPQKPATRADVAVMVYQALVQDGKVEEIDSEHVINP